MKSRSQQREGERETVREKETDKQTETHTHTFPGWNSVGLDFHNISHVNIVMVTDDDAGMIGAQFTVGHSAGVRQLKVCS